jgi:ElaB/YqjD/DUF883 family membrane-anchored ribosome-binding protein
MATVLSFTSTDEYFMVNTPNSRSEKLNVWEIGYFLKSHWKWYLLGGVCGAIIGFALYAIYPSKYQASVVIAPARVGSIIAGGFVQGTEPEPAILMVERFKQPGFFTPAIAESCQFPISSTYQSEMSKTLSASVIKFPAAAGTSQAYSLVRLIWNGASPKIAQDCLAAIIERVSDTQNKIVTPVIEKLAAQTRLTQVQVDLFTSELDKLAARSNTKQANQENFNQIVVADKAAQNLRESLVSARRQLSEDQARLSTPYTQGVSVLEPIYVAATPIFTAGLAIIIGFLAGLMLSILVLLLKRSIWSYHSESANLT